MNTFCRFSLLLPLLALPAGAVNIAPSGTGLMGSNDTTITDTGSSHFQSGTLANIRDGILTTRVDNYQTGQAANVNGYVGISWATARTDLVKGITLTLATFVDGGWFGNRECPLRSRPLQPDMLVPPVVQVSTNLTTWTTVPSVTDYAAAFNGHLIPGDGTPTSRTFNITLPQWQTGIRGIRVIGPTGGYGDGNGFLAVFEMAVEAETIMDADADGMQDAWEAANGLASGTNDAALDADSDGLTNVMEYRWSTNPQLADTDGDGLTDGAENSTHLTFPAMADTDGDALSDAAEVATHLTNPLLADTDGDGLSDGAEISTHSTQAGVFDTDNDGFGDGVEITLATNPLSAASRAANIARAGTALMGTGVSSPRGTAGRTANLNDGNLLSLAVTNISNSHAGIIWRTAWPQPVARLEITLATLDDAGWFGSAGSIGTAFSALGAGHITGAPILQQTTDGVTWTNVPAGNYTTDYVARMIGHITGGGGQQLVTRRSAVFTFTAPVSGLRGLRVLGNCRNYLSVAEITVCDITTAADVDGDGIPNAAEVIAATAPEYEDTDADGLRDGDETVTSPLIVDSDSDYFPDGLEVLLGTDPALASSHPQSLSLVAGGLIGTLLSSYPDLIPTTPGTAVVNAGSVDHLVDSSPDTRVDNWNGTDASQYSFIGARFHPDRRVKVGSLRVQFATFNHAGWFGPGTGPAAGGALTAAHLREPQVQATWDGGATWQPLAAVSDYVAQLTGHVIAGADNVPTRTPVVTFTLLEPAMRINGIRLAGREGGASQPFVGVADFTVLPSYAEPETSVTMSWTPVGNPGNAAHASGRGKVDYQYDISRYEVTIGQYCAFLNSVAASDPRGLYHASMSTNRQVRGIFREGTDGSYRYYVMGDGRRPITFVSWADAARFVNWLANGQGTGSTESGVYDMTLPSHLTVAQVRQAGSVMGLPSVDEWFKAAFHDPAKSAVGGWWNYAPRVDTLVNNSVSANYIDSQMDWAATQTPAGGFPSTSVLLPVGYYGTTAASAYGTHDQTGSVWEWLERDSGTSRLRAGGSWFDSSVPDVAAAPGEQGVAFESDTGGFRVVRVPAAPPLFGSARASGRVTAYVNGNTAGASMQAGPNFVPNGAASFIVDQSTYSDTPAFIAAEESHWNGNPLLSVYTSASGKVYPGNISLKSACNSHTTGQFYAGISEGGWEETILVQSPGQTGNLLYLLMKLNVDAHLHAYVPVGSAGFNFHISTDGPPAGGDMPGFPSSSSTTWPYYTWRHGNNPQDNFPVIKDVVEEIIVPVPVIVGQQVRLRLYAVSSCGLGSIGPSFGGKSRSIVNAKLKHGGYTGLVAGGGAVIPSYTVQSASQIPYGGTAPHFFASPSLSMTPSGGGFQLSWQSWPGDAWQVKKTTDMTNWTTMLVPASAGDSTTFLYTPPPGETRAFFLVGEEF